MLEVRHLLKRYNRIPAVEDVSFTIRPGEVLGYLGPNGAGKSTTVKVLIDSSSRPTVRFFSKAATSAPTCRTSFELSATCPKKRTCISI